MDKKRIFKAYELWHNRCRMQNLMAARASIIIIVSLLIGCGKNFNDHDVDAWADPQEIRAELATELSSDEAMKVRLDHFMLENLALRGSERFASFFGGTDSRAVARWVAQGVRYIAPGSRDKGEIVIQNFGMARYLEGIAQGSFKSIEWTPGRRMTPSQANNGLMLVHHYSRFGNTERTGSWPHERRHGDCDKPPTRSDLLALEAQQKDRWNSGDADLRRCGHMHSVCPKGHQLEGLPACDDSADGAYAYGLEWMRAVRDTCTNCDESIHDVSTALAIDYAYRIVVP